MSEINKDCWIKKTNFKIFGKLIWEKEEICDNSNFKKEEPFAYLVPSVFRPEVKNDIISD